MLICPGYFEKQKVARINKIKNHGGQTFEKGETLEGDSRYEPKKLAFLLFLSVREHRKSIIVSFTALL